MRDPAAPSRYAAGHAVTIYYRVISLLALVLAQAQAQPQPQPRTPTSLSITSISPTVTTAEQSYSVAVELQPADQVEGATVRISSIDTRLDCITSIVAGRGECAPGGGSLEGTITVWALFQGTEALAPSSAQAPHRVNARPNLTLWPLPEQAEDVPITDRWRFAVSDAEDSADDLTVTLRTGRPSHITNEALNGNIVYEWLDGYRNGLLTVRPEPDAFGSIPVIFEVRDTDGATSSLESTLHISAVNDPPRLINLSPPPGTNRDWVSCAFDWLEVDVGHLEADLWTSRLVSFADPHHLLQGRPNVYQDQLCYAPAPNVTGTFQVTIEVTDNPNNGLPLMSTQQTYSVQVIDGTIFAGSFE